jgi:hypothetical protein
MLQCPNGSLALIMRMLYIYACVHATTTASTAATAASAAATDASTTQSEQLLKVVQLVLSSTDDCDKKIETLSAVVAMLQSSSH